MSFKQFSLTALLAGSFLFAGQTARADDHYRNDDRYNRQYENGYYNNGYGPGSYSHLPYMYRDSRGRWQRNEKAYRKYMKQREKELRRQNEYRRNQRW